MYVRHSYLSLPVFDPRLTVYSGATLRLWSTWVIYWLIRPPGGVADKYCHSPNRTKRHTYLTWQKNLSWRTYLTWQKDPSWHTYLHGLLSDPWPGDVRGGWQTTMTHLLNMTTRHTYLTWKKPRHDVPTWHDKKTRHEVLPWHDKDPSWHT